MSWLIKAEEFANGQPCPHAGQYLREFNFDGRGYGIFTEDPKRAKHFVTAGEALEFWRTTSKTKPRRQDGKPNRPLTALTVSIMRTGEAI